MRQIPIFGYKILCSILGGMLKVSIVIIAGLIKLCIKPYIKLTIY